MTPEAVVFDLGNVLIEWQPERFYDRVIGAERRKAMFAEVDLHGMNDQIDLGGPFKDTIYQAAEDNPAWHAEIRMWHDHWIELAAPPIAHSIRLLRALRTQSVPVFSLTNFGIDSFAYAATHYPFLREFDHEFVSGHLGVIKPDARIFEILEAQTGVAPQALLFVDDRPDNIAAAASRGWQTHLFEAPQGWADRLVATGLLSPEDAQ